MPSTHERGVDAAFELRPLVNQDRVLECELMAAEARTPLTLTVKSFTLQRQQQPPRRRPIEVGRPRYLAQGQPWVLGVEGPFTVIGRAPTCAS